MVYWTLFPLAPQLPEYITSAALAFTGKKTIDNKHKRNTKSTFFSFITALELFFIYLFLSHLNLFYCFCVKTGFTFTSLSIVGDHLRIFIFNSSYPFASLYKSLASSKPSSASCFLSASLCSYNSGRL